MVSYIVFFVLQSTDPLSVAKLESSSRCGLTSVIRYSYICYEALQVDVVDFLSFLLPMTVDGSAFVCSDSNTVMYATALCLHSLYLTRHSTCWHPRRVC